MNSLCKHTGTQTLRLSPATGTSLILEASNNFQQPCKMELTAPDTHSISLLFTRRIKKHHQAAKTAEISFSEESKTTRCPLTVSFVSINKSFLSKLCAEMAVHYEIKGVRAKQPCNQKSRTREGVAKG